MLSIKLIRLKEYLETFANRHYSLNGQKQVFQLPKMAYYVILPRINKAIWKYTRYYHKYRETNAYYKDQKFI